MRARKYARYAAPRTRFVNLLADNIIFNVLCFVLIFLTGVMLAVAGRQRELESFAEFLGGMGGKFVFVLAYLFYYTLTESMWGRSPAKFLTRTRVVDAQGDLPGWMEILGRSLCRVIPFDAFSFLFGKDWHDRFSNTFVVYDEQQAPAGHLH